MNGRIRGIVFDKDGTLIDFERTWLPVFIETAETLALGLGRPALAPAWLEAGGQDPLSGRVRPGSVLASGTTRELASCWRALAPDLPPEHELVAWLDLFWEERVLDRLHPIGDLPALLDNLLAGGLALGVATNDTERAAHATLRRLGIAERVAFVAGYDSGHGAKPDPGMILAFCAATGLAPAEVAMVGDSPADLAAGRDAGCGRVIGVLTGASPMDVLAPLADAVVGDVHGLPGLLRAEGTQAPSVSRSVWGRTSEPRTRTR